MIKKTLFLIFICFFAFADVSKIKKELSNTRTVISKMNTRLDKLARKINIKQQQINLLNKKIKILTQQINALSKTLQNSTEVLNSLNDLQKGYRQKLNYIQNSINSFLSTNYYIFTNKAENLNELIHNEVTKKILKIYSHKIAELLNTERDLKTKIFQTSQKIKTILNRQKLLFQKKEEIVKLKQQREKELRELSHQKAVYKQKLEAMIKKQQYLQNKLKELAIIKNTKNKNTAKNTNYTYQTKTYKGIKTTPPLLGTVTKKFGSYIDPVYKIRIYNNTIDIKPYKKNSTVRAIMAGHIVYIDKKRGIIFIKHKNNLFSIYANLSMVSPLLKKGSYVKRGQIIARVADYLEFEITYKDRPINPLKVISLK